MRFTKMHGTGNDFVLVDGSAERVADPSGLARMMSDRHCGIGGDGLVVVMPSQVADIRMRIFNADGGEAEMSGNGIRCLAKYVYERALSRANPMRVETGAGIRTVELAVGTRGRVGGATVDMGEPILEPGRIPVAVEGERAVDVAISAGGGQWRMTCVSMGNPHAVIYVGDVAAVALEQIGPQLEHHAMFRRGTNVHFVQVVSAGEVVAHTWERGSGATLACGTGACAVCVAGVLTGRSEREVRVRVPGGELEVAWRESDNHVYLSGAAVEVFSGEWPT